ncbi:MAG: UDP-N-acetylglucosamine--N-acetylmuramyl-(pentapeptide) pyrophosphoryl-undecaprenol N-acetylglucosamine transferase [Patescibacteria group bacterium]
MSSTNLKILFAGGGSGGHIYPLVAVVEEIKKVAEVSNISLELSYMGPKDEFNNLLAGVGDLKIIPILGAKVRRYFSLANLLDGPKFVISIFQAIIKTFWLMPDVTFSKGGTGGFPVVFASWLFRIPVIIHESDAIPGVTNLVSAKFSKRIAVSFEKTSQYFDLQKTAWVGSPIRNDLDDFRMDQNSAKEQLQFNSEEPLLLVLGGSQGSTRLNEFVITNLADLIKDTQILHQAGSANFNEAKNLSRAALSETTLQEEIKHRYQIVPFLENDLKYAFAAADLIVSRAGSGTIFEIAAFGKPAILIPLKESANDHQKMNAFEFAKNGGGVVIEEENLLPHIFLNQIQNLIKNKEVLNKMSLASKNFFKPGAAKTIAEEILKLGTST